MADGARHRRERVADDLRDLGVPWGGGEKATIILEEVDEALHPASHERMVPTTGTVVAPATTPKTWDQLTQLRIACGGYADLALLQSQRYAA